MPTTKIIGLDPASYKNLGWSIFDIEEQNNTIESIKISAGTLVIGDIAEPWHSLYPIFYFADNLFENQKPNMVVIEKTSSFSGSFITGQVSNCIGVILCVCVKHKIPVSFVFPTHVKKVIVGKGKATKKEMKQSVDKLMQEMGQKLDNKTKTTEHSYDAIANIFCWLIDNDFIQKPPENTDV